MIAKSDNKNSPPKLGSWYGRRRKEINDNAGLIVSLLAAGAAIWSGYVAQKARVESRAAADKSVEVQERSFKQQQTSAQDSLKIQQQSVNAQIENMVLDERPYIVVDYDRVEIHRNEDEAYIKVTALGRTPAVNITLDLRCNEHEAPSSKNFRRDPVEANPLFLNTGQAVYPLSDCERDPNEKQEGEVLADGWIYGIIRYEDIFRRWHYTKFCFNFIPSKRAPKDYDFCDDFRIEVE